MMNQIQIELLAPAKNLDSGRVAINYGADAVYVGANRFGARASAGNSIEDITVLVQYAHAYGAKVFVTLNTILYDHELKEAQRLIWDIYHAGADALIIQDMGIFKMDIPSIPLHASTQTNNYDLERIQILDTLGFERIILARELSLKEIKKIRKQTTSELEFFIHGSLCVSLSGQCYFSQVVTGRSANRGQCAQMCRHPYNLLDRDGNRLALNSHLLSLKDLNLGNELQHLLEAGVTSLKIEGRLKDINYIKNVVSYYRKKLDDLFERDTRFVRASSGKTDITFEPDPERSFSRQSTDYFTNKRERGLVNQETPKSMGKKLGRIKEIGENYITLSSQENLHNGDGLCFIHKNTLHGLRVEKVVNDTIYINNIVGLANGVELYRNYDHDFNKILDADKSRRKVKTKISVYEQKGRLVFKVLDEDNLSSVYEIGYLLDIAKNAGRATEMLKLQLGKSGNSMFDVEEVQVKWETACFFRAAELNNIRRILFEKLKHHRITTFARKNIIRKMNTTPFPMKVVNFSENISNHLSQEFYKEHGVEIQEKALEITSAKANQLLMTTRYCIKYEMGFCERFQNAKNTPPEPLYLEDQNRKYLLDFDCTNCLMHVRLDEKNRT